MEATTGKLTEEKGSRNNNAIIEVSMTIIFVAIIIFSAFVLLGS